MQSCLKSDANVRIKLRLDRVRERGGQGRREQQRTSTREETTIEAMIQGVKDRRGQGTRQEKSVGKG